MTKEVFLSSVIYSSKFIEPKERVIRSLEPSICCQSVINIEESGLEECVCGGGGWEQSCRIELLTCGI